MQGETARIEGHLRSGIDTQRSGNTLEYMNMILTAGGHGKIQHMEIDNSDVDPPDYISNRDHPAQ